MRPVGTAVIKQNKKMNNHSKMNRKKFFEKALFSIVLTWMLLGMCSVSYAQEEISLQPGWNLVASQGDWPQDEGNEALFAELKPFKLDRRTKSYVHASLPLAAGTPLWIYSRNPQTVRFTQEDSDLVLGGISDGKGWHLVAIGGEKRAILNNVLSAWEWRDGRWRSLKIQNGSATLSAGRGYFIYKGKGTATAISLETMSDFQISYYDNGIVSSVSAKFGDKIITVSREEALKMLNTTDFYGITKYEINYSVLEDLIITKYALQKASFFEDENSDDYKNTYNSAIKSALIKTEDNMQNVAGEVVQIGDNLYANDGNSIIKLNISPEKYLELFPPIARYNIRQGGTGDCGVVAAIVSALNNPKSFVKLLSLFSEDENNNLTLNLKTPITFENSELFVMDGLVNEKYVGYPGILDGCDGAKFIEQACLIVRFAEDRRLRYQRQEIIEEIDIDEAIKYVSDFGTCPADEMNIILGCNTFDRVQTRVKFPINELNYDSSIFDNMSNEQIALYKEDAKNYITANTKYMNCGFGLTNIVREMPNDILVMDASYDIYTHGKGNIWKDALKDDGSVDIAFLRKHQKWDLGYEKYTDSELIKITNFMNSNNYNFTQLHYGFLDIRSKFLKDIEDNNDSKAIFDFAEDITRYAFLEDDFNNMLNSLDTVGFVETFINMPNYIKENYYNYLDFLADKVADGDIIMSVSFGHHAYSVKSIDKENKTIKIMDPQYSYITQLYSYDDYFKTISGIDIGYIDDSLFNEHVLHMYAIS
jgi:hypothetical protein